MPKPTRTSTVFVGIDPGITGAIADLRYSPQRGWQMVVTPMPVTERDISRLIQSLSSVDTICCLEKVSAFPGQGVTAMFTFGRGYGFIRGCLVSAAIPVVDVAPQTWMRALGLRAKKKTETKTRWKQFLRGIALNRFPEADGITNHTADAVLIAEYCRLFHQEGSRA